MLAALLTWASLAGTPILLGVAALGANGIRWSEDRLAFVPWVYAAGTLAVALLLWVWTWVGLPLDVRLAWPLFASAAVLLWMTRARARPAPAAPPPSGSRIGWALLAAALVIALGVTADRIAVSTAQLVAETDEATIWAAKAKAVYRSGGFNAAFREATGPDARPFLHHADYPLLNPLLQLWVFIHRGAVVHLENRVPIQLCVPALLLLLAAAVRRVARPEVAALLVLALAGSAMTRMLTLYAYADHMVAFGWLLALDAWLRHGADGEARWWRLAMVGVTFTLWSKNEGVLLAATAVVAAGVALLVRRARAGDGRGWQGALEQGGLPARARDLLWCLLPIAVAAVHFSANRALGFENDLFAAPGWIGSLAPAELAQRAPTVAAYAARRALEPPLSIGMVPVLFLALIILFPGRVWRSRLAVPALSFALAMAAYVLVYVATYHPLPWHLETSFARVSYQLTPALALWICAFAAELWPALRPPSAAAVEGGRVANQSRSADSALRPPRRA